MFVKFNKPIFLIMLVLIFVVMISGCTSGNNNFENSWMKVQVPTDWKGENVDDRVFESTKTEPTSTIIIGKDTDTRNLSLEERSKDFSTATEGESMKVLKNESVNISGVTGVYIITQYSENSRPFNGAEIKTATILFDKNGKRYMVSSQEQYPNIFDSTIVPALNTIIKTLQIK